MDDAEAFRESLIQHIEASKVTISDLARQSGVSKGLLDKLRQRRAVSTNVRDAMRIAAFFGKTIEQFVAPPGRTEKIDELRNLLGQLGDAELRILRAQIKAVVALKRENSTE